MIRLITLFLLLPIFSWAQTDAALDAARKKLDTKNFVGAKADLTKVIDASPKNKLALYFSRQKCFPKLKARPLCKAKGQARLLFGR